MKATLSILIILILSMSARITSAQQVIVSDDPDYTTPASGSVLDVKSTSKGFMPPRVALTGTTDATTVASPSTGLMVYNTATAGTSPNNVIPGYYYNSGTSGSPVWSKVMNENVTNGMSIQDDGAPILNGSATAWNDMVISPSVARNNGTNVPAWASFATPDIYTWMFEDSKLEEITFSLQVPHDYKTGSTIYPHVHWAPMSDGGTSRVRWTIDYQWVNLGSAYSATTTSNNTGYLLYNDAGSPTVSLTTRQSTITPLGSIDGTGMAVSSILMCRLYRDGNGANDNLGANAALLSVDFHYEVDAFGSRTPYAK